MMASISIEFSKPEIGEFIERQVKAGSFKSTEAVVEEALVRMMSDEEPSLSDEDWQAIGEADAEIERGEYVEWETVKAQLKSKYGMS
jgi:Arc/MetJ-type ribon-helix-helix transcriptional regulator